MSKSGLKQFFTLRKKREVNSAGLLITGLVLILVAFYAGNVTSYWVQLPGIKPAHAIDFSSLNSVYELMQRNFDGKLTDQAALDGAKEGLVASGGDPFTEYLPATEATALNSELNDSLSGIGAEIGEKNGAITIIAPIAGTPAAKAGLRDGDVIERINGVNTATMTVDDAVTKIRGKAGTTVTLRIDRADTPQPIDFTITRANINVPSVTSSMKSSDIGYINISQFTSNTGALLDQAATQLKQQGATKIILDLRDNPGGYLDQAVAVASEFLPQGKVVVSEKAGNPPKTIPNGTSYSSGGGQLVGVPTVVLVNGGSASASEIVAGALHDNHASTLEGETTYFMGSVHTIMNLSGGAELKVTIAHWYTPAGININIKGITPDVQVPLTSDDYNSGADPQLDKAIQLLQ